MSGSPPHGKSRRSHNDPGHTHFVTYSCRNRWPLLSTDRSRRWVLQAMEQTRTRLGIAICACVIMPEHVHMLLVPQNEHDEMRQVLASLKAPVARAAKAHLERTSNHAWLSRLTTSHGARKTFRFWQPGGGYDKNPWQTRSIEEVIAYIHANPVRRGLAERPAAWPWSSAQNYDGVAVDRSKSIALNCENDRVTRVHLNQVLDQRSVELPFKMPISLSPSMASKSTAHIAVAHKTWYVDVKRISRPTQFAVLPARMSSHDATSMVSRNTQSRGTRT